MSTQYFQFKICCPSVWLSVCLSEWLSDWFADCVWLLDCRLPVCLNDHLSDCMTVLLTIWLHDCLFQQLCLSLSVRLSVWLNVCLTVCLNVCLSDIWLSVCPSDSLIVCLSVERCFRSIVAHDRKFSIALIYSFTLVSLSASCSSQMAGLSKGGTLLNGPNMAILFKKSPRLVQMSSIAEKWQSR